VHSGDPHRALLHPRKRPTCRSHPSSWFQLVKVWLTTFRRFHSEIFDLRDPRRQPIALETPD
jgi:hypothetical protein